MAIEVSRKRRASAKARVALLSEDSATRRNACHGKWRSVLRKWPSRGHAHGCDGYVALFNNEVPFSLAKLRVSDAVAISIRDLTQGRFDKRCSVSKKVAILQ